jgi:hypothetical protein
LDSSVEEVGWLLLLLLLSDSLVAKVLWLDDAEVDELDDVVADSGVEGGVISGVVGSGGTYGCSAVGVQAHQVRDSDRSAT